MSDSASTGFKDDVLKNPATDRLREELGNYLRARAEHTVTRLGSRLGEGVSKLAEPGVRRGKELLDGSGGDGEDGGGAKKPGRALLGAGASHLKDMVKDKVGGALGKGGKGGGGGKSKSVTIVEDIDVGVPVREAYDQWTRFQEFSSFAKGVVSVEKVDDTSSNWKVKVAKSTRSWKANVTEQVPDERIVWTTEGAKGTVKGVVTFHALTDDLTRVLLVLEYFPGGVFEKVGNIWRAQGRRARLDLKLYRKFIMMRGEAGDGWRGEIRDGEVVADHEDVVREEEERADQETSEDTEARGDGEPDEESDGEPEEELDEEPAPDDRYEDEDEPVEDDGEEQPGDEPESEPESEYEDEPEYEDEAGDPEDDDDLAEEGDEDVDAEDDDLMEEEGDETEPSDRGERAEAADR
ncbi:SRPBCC family protein [Streptomyces alkaliphilus]|uniref:SRPBCC family protein n=1 Tax=Streptomyces alkaliphilus TaxID=1472722 RepID=UPI00117E37D4|nr:SRPBCC family protein [Streptomyces alkaliphilus]MQS05900.1 cyclase [Streptomyces alkaliphilus]